jgi:hypothetical protein
MCYIAGTLPPNRHIIGEQALALTGMLLLFRSRSTDDATKKTWTYVQHKGIALKSYNRRV